MNKIDIKLEYFKYVLIFFLILIFNKLMIPIFIENFNEIRTKFYIIDYKYFKIIPPNL